MINKVIVAAAGRGTRMLHHSQDKPKHLIEINGKPFLYYLLNRLKEAGFKEIIMVIGYQQKIMKEVLNKFEDQFPVTVVNQFSRLKDKYGTACPIECIEQEINKENFVAVCGDNLWSVADLKSIMIDDNLNYLAGFFSEHPEKYGVLITDENDYLINIKEKPQEFAGNLINAGLYKFTPEIFSKIALTKKSIRGEYELTDAINLLAHEKKVKVKKINDYWLDFGKPDDISVVSKFLKNNK
ncbi:NTP transferase domain-containing protein [Patescibacteria group bacterium]|nr:NTP transferase domain-containing protein [Patescibacteria group bacterium]